MQERVANSAEAIPDAATQPAAGHNYGSEVVVPGGEKFPEPFRTIESVDVLVIGAGPAGLACMRKLQNHSSNLRAILAEASSAIGGRVRSALIGGPQETPREGGAEFAYQDLLTALGALGVSVDQRELVPVAPYSREAMCIFDGDTIQDATQFFGAYDPDEIRNQLFMEMKAFGRDISIEEFMGTHSVVYKELSESAPKVADIIRQGLIGEYACQSLNEMGIAVCAEQAEDNQEVAHHNTLSGDVFRVVGGYRSLISKLEADIDVRKKTPVEAIEYLADGSLFVTARDSKSNTACHFVAQQVVLAVPVPSLSNIKFPSEINAEQAIQRATMGTYNEGHVVKVVFKSTKSLLPEGKEVLAMVGKPIEVWQRKVADNNYQCTLWIAGPAALDFDRQSGMGIKRSSSPATSSSGSGEGHRSNAHKLVSQMISDIFGEDCSLSITRMSILPWQRMKHAGHAYRTVKPTGQSFEQLKQPHFIELGPRIYLTGADINLATVPSALTSGAATADMLIARNL